MNVKSVLIGKVIEISNISISVAIEFEHPYKVINGVPLRIGGVGNFLKVGNDVYEIINEKISLEDSTTDDVSKITCNKVIICSLIGFFQGEEFFQGNSGHTPNVFENVYTVTSNELISIYVGNQSKDYLTVGEYIYQRNLKFQLNINKFFASHALIVGNTGSGKSNTLNTIYTRLFSEIDTENSYFLFIDTNGEYADAFCSSKSIKYLNTYNYSRNTINIPLSLLDAEDWKLILEATDKTQYPIIKKTWTSIRRSIFESGAIDFSEYITKKLKDCIKGILSSNTIASNKLGAINSIYEDMQYLNHDFYEKLCGVFTIFEGVSVNNNRLVKNDVFIDICKDLADEIDKYVNTGEIKSFGVYDYGFLLNLEHLHRTYKYNTNENNTSPMIVRFNTNKSELDAIFSAYSAEDDPNIFNCLFGTNKITVCDVSHAKKDIRRIIVTFICSKLYTCQNKRSTPAKSLHLIVDEAHNYLSQQNMDAEDAVAKTCIETFEGIIKEGRKFHTFLTMATQRPSDITSTLLSQSHNYVIHKLVNPKDIDIIKNTVPFIDNSSMKMLSILAPGQAIFSGTAFNRPNIIKVDFDEKDTKVNSATLKLMSSWQFK